MLGSTSLAPFVLFFYFICHEPRGRAAERDGAIDWISGCVGPLLSVPLHATPIRMRGIETAVAKSMDIATQESSVRNAQEKRSSFPWLIVDQIPLFVKQER